MLKNSPLFILKISILTLFSIFLSFLISYLDMIKIENISNNQTINILLIFYFIVGIIFYCLIYFLNKRKNVAKNILVLLGVIGVISYIYSMFFLEYSKFQGLLYLLVIFLDFYTLILLFSEDANNFIKKNYVENENKGNFKIWFSALSSLILIVLFGAKFLNNYDFKNTEIKSNLESEIISDKNSDVDLESLISDSNPNYNDEGLTHENSDTSNNQILEHTVNNIPVAVRFSINDINSSIYNKTAYNIVIQGRADREVIINDVVLNRGNKCGLSKYALEKQLPAILKFGEYIELSIGACDAQMVQEIEVKTSFGNYIFRPQG
ncbi:hypothetical protein ABTJ72_01435 [Acinetobacter baumannii]